MGPQSHTTAGAAPEKTSLLRTAAGLVWVAVRSILLTTAGMTAFGAVLAAAAYYFLRHEPWYAAIGAAVALVESIATGLLLGAKRGMVLALVEGLERLQLGRSAIQLIFQRILRLSEGEEIGDRGSDTAQILERIPLAQAERYLTRAVGDTVKGDADAPGLGGWVRRKIQSRLCALVARFTLARFREADAKHGGIDLRRIQADLETKVDAALTGKLRGGLTLWTALALFALPATIAIEVYLAIMLIGSK